MAFELPEKKILAAIIILASLGVINYVVMFITPPEGRVFVGYVDAGFQLAEMKSVIWNFASPWDFGITVFENPHLGGPYTLVLLGTLPALLSINMFVYFVIIRFVLAIVLLLLVHYILYLFIRDKNNVKVAFILFLFASGIGWILYSFMSVSAGQETASLFSYAFTYEFEEGDSGALAINHISRIYWIVPDITGLLSLFLFAKRRKIPAGFFLGLTWLFHPTFGLPFSLALLLYQTSQHFGEKNLVKNVLENTVPVVAVSLLFMAPWIFFYAKSPQHFTQYKAWFTSTPLITLTITNFFLLLLSFYGLHKNIGKSAVKNKYFVLLFIVFGALSSIGRLYETTYIAERPDGGGNLTTWMQQTGIFDLGSLLYFNPVLADVPLIGLLVVLFFSVLRTDLEKNYKFIILWLIGILAITIVPSSIIGGAWWPGRMKWFLLLPLSAASVTGIEHVCEEYRKFRLSKKFPMTPLRVALIIAIISIPALLGFNFHLQRVAHNSDISYLSESDFAAMNFLVEQSEGRVLSSWEIGHSIPYLTNKKSFLFNNVRDERYADYEKFYSANTGNEDKLSIIKKYGISYVFYGENEMSESNSTFDPGSLDFMERIYENSTSIYKFSG